MYWVGARHGSNWALIGGESTPVTFNCEREAHKYGLMWIEDHLGSLQKPRDIRVIEILRLE